METAKIIFRNDWNQSVFQKTTDTEILRNCYFFLLEAISNSCFQNVGVQEKTCGEINIFDICFDFDFPFYAAHFYF